ncbi:MAG TPA: hypothetical protein VND93_27465 [Myxococcales bacterium]|nr:hypothetical protein [Myxococcales bacterium]
MPPAAAARAALQRRAERAGAASALQIPVHGEPPAVSAASALAALSRRAERAGAGSALEIPVRTDEATFERSALLARSQAPAPARARPASSSEVTSRALERALARVPASPLPNPGAPSSVPLEGLAGMAARAAASSSPVRAPSPRDDAHPPPSLLATPSLPEPALPAVLAERQEEAELARRLERILRREAEQAGVDLEGLEP